ncbi:MAG: FAD-dependent thymidylate synthase [Pseudomonas sp.]
MGTSAKVVAHSRTFEHDVELVSLETRYWRGIHAEVMTHRVFSRNAGSSRAKPLRHVMDQVLNDPAGPLHWGANRPGMQAKEELTGWRLWVAKKLWRLASLLMWGVAWGFEKIGLHKQVANRILEPFQWIDVLITATEWDNFFQLRMHPDAQPEIQELATVMHAAIQTSIPRVLSLGEWHLPYVKQQEHGVYPIEELKKFSAARSARISYKNFDGSVSQRKDQKLFTQLTSATPMHASPLEHVATPMPTAAFNRNFRGWGQFRVELEKE